MPELYSATLNPRGPNYQSWHEVLGADRVPLKSAQSFNADLGVNERNVEVYQVNMAAMTLKQRARLVGHLAQKFGVPVYEIEAELNKSGFPIRAADVIVSFDVRAFV